MDLIHKLTNVVDHNRGTVAGLGVLLCSLCLASCAALDGNVISSNSGKKLDQDGLRAEYVAESKELQARYDAAVELIREGQAAVERVERDAEQLDADYVADAQRAAIEVEERNQKIGAAAQWVATATGIPWLLPLVSIGTTATAAGAVYDNRRKDKVIQKQKPTPEAS